MTNDRLLNAYIEAFMGLMMYFGSLFLIDVCKPQFMISIYTPMFVMPYIGLLILIVASYHVLAYMYHNKTMGSSEINS